MEGLIPPPTGRFSSAIQKDAGPGGLRIHGPLPVGQKTLILFGVTQPSDSSPREKYL
jgi:hypothetical protein